MNIDAAKHGPNKRYLKRAAVVLATNSETMELARRLGATRVALFLDSGVSDEFLLPYPPRPSDSRPLRVLWVGRLLPRKALPLALFALAEATQDIVMTIVGDGPELEPNRALAAKLGLAERVRFALKVPHDEMPSVYKAHQVFLFTGILDSFGTQLLEAMASGLPVITLNHQGAKVFVPDGASIKVPVGTVKATSRALAAALEAVGENPGRRSRMGRVAWEYAMTERWPARASRMTNVYENVIASRRLL